MVISDLRDLILSEAGRIAYVNDELELLLKKHREAEAHHRRYADGIAAALEPVRVKRENGEPALSDRREIERLRAVGPRPEVEKAK